MSLGFHASSTGSYSVAIFRATGPPLPPYLLSPHLSRHWGRVHVTKLQEGPWFSQQKEHHYHIVPKLKNNICLGGSFWAGFKLLMSIMMILRSALELKIQTQSISQENGGFVGIVNELVGACSFWKIAEFMLWVWWSHWALMLQEAFSPSFLHYGGLRKG